MSDPYAIINKIDKSIQEHLATGLENRANDKEQMKIVDEYLSHIDFPPNSSVLEIGSGTGPICRKVSTHPNVAKVEGLDYSPIFTQMARELSKDNQNITYREGDGRELPYQDNSFDVVMFHTTLSHIPEHERAVAEASRVLRKDGYLAIYEPDFPNFSISMMEDDPLQECAEAFVKKMVTNKYVVRGLRKLVLSMVLTVVDYRYHVDLVSDNTDYVVTLVNRAADIMLSDGVVDEAGCADLKAEAVRRVENDEFFGVLPCCSIIAKK